MTENALESFIDANGNTIDLKLRFPRDSYKRFRVGSLDELLANDYELLKHFIEAHKTKQAPRLQELLDYARGFNHTILAGDNRRHETDMADTRAVHNYGGLFSTLEQGFIAGIPIRVEYLQEEHYDEDGNLIEVENATEEVLQDIATDNDFKQLNRSIIKSASQMGRAYDIVYHNRNNETKVRKLNPVETFVIFDQTLSEHSVAAVRYYTVDKLEVSTTYVELYTDTYSIKFIKEGETFKEIEGSKELHGFKDVPITEYRRNEMGIGSYETVLTLIDMYDANQSDTANYMTDLADAILAIFGNVSFPDEFTEQQKLDFMKLMRKSRLMLLKPPTNNEGQDSGTIDAKYLTKSYDVKGAEAQKSRIEKDIHKFANMPNLSDDNFGGVQSGEAMKYKLMGLEQEVTDIQAEFEKGLRRRYELIARVEQAAGKIREFDMRNLKVTFTLNLPKSQQEMVATLKGLGGMVSNETALRISGLVEDVEAELKLLEPVVAAEYDADKPKPDNMYKILAVVGKFKKGQVNEANAIKYLINLDMDEAEARDYLELPPLTGEVGLDGLV